MQLNWILVQPHVPTNISKTFSPNQIVQEMNWAPCVSAEKKKKIMHLSAEAMTIGRKDVWILIHHY